jgi:hypothetical protein
VQNPPLAPLPDIPVIECGADFPVQTLVAHLDRAHALLDLATARVPVTALRHLDRLSRAWLVKWENAHLSEIDAVARIIDRPGAHFFSVNYEWGCTCRVAPATDGASARLLRVLDWTTPGLGANVIAACVTAPAGRYVTLTWPGYTGVLSALAPGRFAVALNQAPMRKAAGFYYLDWAANRVRVWSMPHPTPAHVLRSVCDEAISFDDAVGRLEKAPLSTPAIFSVSGLGAPETVVIERTETEARVHRGSQVAANHWQSNGWLGHPRGVDSAGRAAMLARIDPAFGSDLRWLKPPVLNARTRLVMVGEAVAGRIEAQGFEREAPATARLDLTINRRTPVPWVTARKIDI